LSRVAISKHEAAAPDFFTEHGRCRVITAENFERGLPLGMITNRTVGQCSAA
jgi:hypothetical protein